LLFIKEELNSRKKSWQENITSIISQAIFYEEDEDEPLTITFDNKKLLHNPRFRQYLIDEVIHAMKNFSGTTTGNLKKLYVDFGPR